MKNTYAGLATEIKVKVRATLVSKVGGRTKNKEAVERVVKGFLPEGWEVTDVKLTNVKK